MSTNRVAVVEANLDAYLESAETAPKLLEPGDPRREVAAATQDDPDPLERDAPEPADVVDGGGRGGEREEGKDGGASAEAGGSKSAEEAAGRS